MQFTKDQADKIVNLINKGEKFYVIAKKNRRRMYLAGRPGILLASWRDELARFQENDLIAAKEISHGYDETRARTTCSGNC